MRSDIDTHRLHGKKILITSGPTWVPLDSVRVISNIASGQTGTMLAARLAGLGAKVTLILGPVKPCGSLPGVKVVQYCYFKELQAALRQALRSTHYDAVIHSAAVSDFRPARQIKGKIASGKVQRLILTPLPKLVAEIKKISPRSTLVMFKLESGISDAELIKKACLAGGLMSADFIVANRLTPSYKAFLIDLAAGKRMIAGSRRALVDNLVKIL